MMYQYHSKQAAAEKLGRCSAACAARSAKRCCHASMNMIWSSAHSGGSMEAAHSVSVAETSAAPAPPRGGNGGDGGGGDGGGGAPGSVAAQGGHGGGYGGAVSVTAAAAPPLS